MKTNKGFSLIELMAVIVIIGIVSTVSYGFLGQYVKTSNRTEARAALSETAGLLEKCRSLYGRYDNDNCGTVTRINAGFNTESEYYVISADSLESTAFVIRATPIGKQTSDSDCTWLTISNTGLKAGSNLAACW